MRIRGLRRVAPWEQEDHFHPGETIQVPPYGFGETIVWLRDGFVRTEDIQGDEHVHLVGHVRHGRGGLCKPCSVDLERVNDAAETAYEQEEGVTAAGTPVPRQTTVALNAEDVDEPEEKAPEHYVAVWFPGDLLCPGPDADTMCGWDLIDEPRWQEHGFGSTWGMHSELPRSASATDLTSQIAAELRVAARDVEVTQDPDGFVIDSIGIPGTTGFRQGPCSGSRSIPPRTRALWAEPSVTARPAGRGRTSRPPGGSRQPPSPRCLAEACARCPDWLRTPP